MSHDHSNSHYNRYATLADEATIHSVTDDEYSVLTEQALEDEFEQLLISQLQLEDELRSFDDNIREFSSNLSNHTTTSEDEDEFDIEDEAMTSTLPALEMKKELRGNAVGVTVRADVQQYMDNLSNELAKAQHPLHSGGCAHLLDDVDRYRRRVGEKNATLPLVTKQPEVPGESVTSGVTWKRYDSISKVFNLETHYRNKALELIVDRYPVIMEQLKTDDFDALPLDLNLCQAFDHIMKNVTDVVTTREEYVKTNAKLLTLTCEAGNDDGVQNYFIEVTKITRRLSVLSNGKTYDSDLLIAQCQSKIRDSGISKRELRKIDKEWATEDKDKDAKTRFE